MSTELIEFDKNKPLWQTYIDMLLSDEYFMDKLGVYKIVFKNVVQNFGDEM